MQSSTFQRFPCAGCGTDMLFDPVTGGLKCPSCGGTKAVAAQGSVEEIPFDGSFRNQDIQKISETALQVNCTGCGATVEFQPPEVAGSCPFCAAAIVAQPKSADPHIAPAAVLPFGLVRDQASKLIKDWLGGLWFAPSGLQALARQESINGVYLPFWTYDARTSTSYHGQRGDYYYERQIVTRTDANGRSEQVEQQVRQTRWSSASGRVRNEFDDLVVCASKSVQRDKIRETDPWDLDKLQPYDPAFLSGFKAQRYQVELNEGFEQAKQQMESSIRGTILRDIGGDEQQVHSSSTDYYDVTFKHILLPVWIGAYKFQGRVFQVLVNARTGEVQGERPYSAGKIFLAVVAVIAIIVLLISLNRK
jgi:ribosomal protein S27E